MTSIYKSEEGKRQVEARYREFLGNWPAANRQFHVPTCEGETYVIASGPEDAPPVILLHGSAFNSSSWVGDVPSWSEHFRVYAVDVIGHPGLSAPSRPDYESEAHALWLDDVLGALGIEEAAFVGISLGGWLTIDYTTRRPDRVTSIALLAPGGVGRETTPMLKIFFVVLPLLAMGNWGREKARDMLIGPMPANITEGAEEVGAFMSLINRHFRQRVDRVARFSDERLARLKGPVLLIVGDADPMLDTAETVERVKATVPHAEVHVLDNVGHAVIGQTAKVLDFLRRTLGQA